MSRKFHKADKSENKVERVMREFKEGKLKSSNGKLVTDKAQALAIALSEAGLSSKSMQKAELVNKLRVYKADLEQRLQKNLESEQSVKAEVLKLFRQPNSVKDTDVHGLADRLKVPADQLEQSIYKILHDLLSDGKSEGKIKDVNPSELEAGIKVEREHTLDKDVAEKITRDHLAEDPKYYTKLKKMEAK